MKKHINVLVVAALAVGALSMPAGPAHAQDNAAVVVNTHDGLSLFRFAFKIQRTMSDVVDQSNAAVAFSSCSECTSTAVALQVVLIMSDPEVVTTENLALALNYDCSLCQTFASAYQYVLTTGGPVHFTPEGSQSIAELRRQMLELVMSGAPPEELNAELDALVAELEAVLANELVLAGAQDDPVEGTPTPEPTATVAPTTAPTVATPEPTAVPTSP